MSAQSGDKNDASLRFNEWREQKPTYNVPRGGVIIMTSWDSVLPISYGITCVLIHRKFRLKSVIARELPMSPRGTGPVGR